MDVNKNKKDKKVNEMTAQERHAIYSKSTFFKKKNEDVKEFLKKHPIPKEYLQQ